MNQKEILLIQRLLYKKKLISEIKLNGGKYRKKLNTYRNDSLEFAEFNRLGTCEVTLGKRVVTHVNATLSPDVGLYTSSSTTDSKRLTFSFLDDKVSFLGN